MPKKFPLVEPEFPLVKIVWDDITGHEDQWISSTTISLACRRMESVGYLLVDNEAGVVLAQDLDREAKMVHGVSSYPRGAVVNVEPI